VGDVLALLDRLPDHNGVSLVINGSGSTKLDAAAVPVPGVIPVVKPASGLAPALENHAFRLTPVGPDDTGFLYALAVRPETGFRWRYRGAPPPAERFAADLWAQVLVQYVVRRTADGEPLGHVVAYGAELVHGHCFLGAVFTPEHSGRGYAAESVAMFVRYLFHTFPLRKVYLEIPGFNWAQLSSAAGGLFEVEGVLRGHDYYAGRYWDKYLCAIYPPEYPPDERPA
jgi:RimJ/RimL family protein N-acetyltransferase